MKKGAKRGDARGKSKEELDERIPHMLALLRDPGGGTISE